MRIDFNTGSISPRRKRAQGVIKEQLRSRFEHPALRVVVLEFQNCCPRADKVIAQHFVYEKQEHVDGFGHHVAGPLEELRIARHLVPRRLTAILEPRQTPISEILDGQIQFPATAANVITVGTLTLTANPTGLIVGVSTVLPGGPAITEDWHYDTDTHEPQRHYSWHSNYYCFPCNRS